MAFVGVAVDSKPISDLAQALAATGRRLPNAQALVLNRVVTRARPKVVMVVAAKTGIFAKIISRAVRPLRASPKNLRAGLVSRGGEISLRYFKAREEGSGVVAEVAGEREFIAGGFRRSGRAPNRRMVSKLNKQVYVNPSRKWRGEIEKQRSGVYIPTEMIGTESRAAFDDVAVNQLPAEVAKELAKILPGASRR